MAPKPETPVNDLDEIKRLVCDGAYSINRKSRLELQEIEFATDDIEACIASLRVEPHFDDHREYDDDEGIADVYLIWWTYYRESIDENVTLRMYIKVRINPSGRAVLFLSFHPEKKTVKP